VRKILVLGGFGFTGSHLVEHLLADPEQEVHVVDDLSSSPLPLDALLAEIGPATALSWSIETVESFFAGNGGGGGERWDEIYHLASIVGPAGVLPHAGRIAAALVTDLLRVAEAALATGARLLFVSTSEVYGGGGDGLCSESSPKRVPAAASPRLEYAVGKLAAEIALENLCAKDGLDARIVRPFNIAGPRQSGAGGFVLPRFVGQALAGRELTVFGDGSQVRAFTHVEDIARGLAAALRHGAPGAVYNLGNPRNRTTVLELARMVLGIGGCGCGGGADGAGRIRFVDPREVYGALYTEAADKLPDAARATAELGWQPRHDLAATVADSFAYMRALPAPLRARLQGF
jgi:nucleoside-diphosphate-sugar epimerase